MIPYMGGKSTIAQWIIDHFPVDYVNSLYVEVFGGAGWVLFKKQPSVNDVYNDAFHNIVNLFKVIRDRYPQFRHKVKWTLHSRRMFNDARLILGQKNVKDVDRALAYLIVKLQSFSATETSYGYGLEAKNRNKWAGTMARIEQIRERLQKVNIESLDFEKLIDKYDTERTVFYLDPPYIDKEHYYHVPFTLSDHERLAAALKCIKGRFLLSYYPHHHVARLYRNFNVISRDSIKSSCGVTRLSKTRTRPKSTELLIMNY